MTSNRRLCGLATAIWLSLATVSWGQSASPLATGDAKSSSIDLSYVSADAFVGAQVHVSRILKAPSMEMLPIEVIAAASKQELGIDPFDVETVLAIGEAPVGLRPPGFGIIVHFSKPYAADRLLRILQQETVPAEIAGRAYRRARHLPMGPSVLVPDDRTLLVATEPTLRRMLQNKKNPADSDLKRRLRRVQGDPDAFVLAAVEPVRDLVKGGLARVPIPKELKEVKQIPDLLAAIELDISVTSPLAAVLALEGRDEPATKEIERIIDQSLDTGRRMLIAEVVKNGPQDPVAEAGAKYMERWSRKLVEAIRPVRRQNRLLLEGRREMLAQIGPTSVLVALLLPAVQAAREAARRTASQNNLRQIGTALHAYYETHRRFPARATFDANGKPLLSWRVQLLPHLEQGALYNQFKLDEPWDSPNNKKLIERMPTVFKNPNVASEDFKTNYLAPVGLGTVFGGTEGVRIRDITNGSSRTIQIVEANPDTSVTWTRPDDLPYDSSRPLHGLGSLRPGGFLALFADGSVQFIANGVGLSVLRSMFNYASDQIP